MNQANAAAEGQRGALAQEALQLNQQVGSLRAEQNRLQLQVADLQAKAQAELAALEQAGRDRAIATRDRAALNDDSARLEARRDILRREVAEQEERVAKAGEVARAVVFAELARLIEQGEALIVRIRQARQEGMPPPAEPEAVPGGEP
jgi:chromosome segregation ATPase